MNWKITCLRKCLFSLIALFMGMGILTAQEVRITGTVTSADDGSPLPGVSVVRQGTTNGTITDLDGKYTISVPKGSVIVFSFIGMQKQEVTVGNQATYNVALVTETTGINEVVVTALGIKRDKKALGYSISSIKSDELVESGIPVNPLTSLYGKAAGVRVSSTANGPTGGMIINIRNSVSLTSSSSTRPLFVVDGIPIFDENTAMNRNDRDGRDRGTGINDINAEDVASIEILKGAKASVLYGYAGANGVVLITTKTGTKKKGLGIDFTARDLQRKFKETGNPWELCKGFDNSAPISEFIPKEELGDLNSLPFSLDLNGKTVQQGTTTDMIFNIDTIIAYVSRFFTLKMGDLIFTGTPVGVGTVKIGDRLEGYLKGRKMLDFKVE